MSFILLVSACLIVLIELFAKTIFKKKVDKKKKKSKHLDKLFH